MPDFDYRELVPQEINARNMTAAQMGQLTANIRRDGYVTSAVLAYRNPETGKVETLSGHHRAEAAIAAEVFQGPVIVITSTLTEQRKRAIQMSHNAIVGQDDPSTLLKMWSGLDLSAKAYSGLDDGAVNALQKVSLAGLSVAIKYQELHLFFLDEDAEVVTAALPKLEKAARKKAAYVMADADFDEFFQLVVRAKTKFQCFNSAMAVRLLVDLATQALDADDAAQPDSEASPEAVAE